jgi:predicted Rossmann fold nucleotide-binding protein DprA/Smf involved in DNA uptake
MQQVSPDTQAILLLCGHFGRKGRDAVSPLSPKEYGRFARWLRDKQARPAGLLSDRADELLADVLTARLERGRIKTLLQRGTALALASEKWFRSGLWIISRSDESYPKRLKKRLGYGAPALLFGAGDMRLLEGGGLAIVGSRDASESVLEFTREVAVRCAKENIAVISGGARGVDSAAMQSASEAGGTVVGVLADGLLRASTHRTNRRGLLEGQLVLVSPYDPEAGFNAGNAMARNRHIYALADYGLVVQSDQGKGGTWAGATENLRERWVPLLVRESTEVPGNAELIERGGVRFAFNPRGSLRQYLDEVGQRVARLAVAADAEAAGPDMYTSEQRVHTVGSAFSEIGEAAELLSPVPNDGAGCDEQHDVNRLDTQDMFPEFSRRIQSLLASGPRSATEIQEAMGLEPVQARAWLKKAEQERLVMKTKRPVRFVLASEGRLF